MSANVSRPVHVRVAPWEDHALPWTGRVADRTAVEEFVAGRHGVRVVWREEDGNPRLIRPDSRPHEDQQVVWPGWVILRDPKRVQVVSAGVYADWYLPVDQASVEPDGAAGLGAFEGPMQRPATVSTPPAVLCPTCGHERDYIGDYCPGVLYGDDTPAGEAPIGWYCNHQCREAPDEH